MVDPFGITFWMLPVPGGNSFILWVCSPSICERLRQFTCPAPVSLPTSEPPNDKWHKPARLMTNQAGLPPAGSFGSSGCSGLVGYWSRCPSSTFWWVVWPLPSRPSSLAPSCSPLWSSSGPLCLIGFGRGSSAGEFGGSEMQQVWHHNMGFIWFHVPCETVEVKLGVITFWETFWNQFLGDFFSTVSISFLILRSFQDSGRCAIKHRSAVA